MAKTYKKAVKKKLSKKEMDIHPPQKLFSFYIKLAGLFAFFIILIAYSDYKGYFNPDLKNNHTLKKWNSFYEFTKTNNVDILLLGNSHLYTGINPKNLSLALGANAFILASPGTNVSDSYWSLKEALKSCDPKVVIIETYGINGFNPYQLEAGSLSDQFKSFSARKDFVTKLESTPYLFSRHNYLFAWSNTIRNHNFLVNNYDQIKENLKLIEDEKKGSNNKKLYLGRFVSFLSGIDNKNLERYKTEGAPVDGENYTYSEYSREYVEKIADLCSEKKIKLIFLTLPMYEKHIANYQVWKNKIGELLSKYDWINMQKEERYHSIGFDAFAFQNTFKSNQHMTYNGSLLATYSLASYIREKVKDSIPKRDKDIKWLTLFYGDEGYFENYSPGTNDKNCKIICQNKKIKNAELNEVLLLNNKKNKTKTLISKILKNDQDIKNKALYLMIKFLQSGQEKVTYVKLDLDIFHTPEKYIIYKQTLKPIEITDIVGGELK